MKILFCTKYGGKRYSPKCGGKRYTYIPQVLAASCLEIWAMHQPGGDTLHLRIQVNWKTGKLEAKVHLQVEVEERLYGKQMLLKDLGHCKAIKLTFNDPNTTQATFTFLLL